MHAARSIREAASAHCFSERSERVPAGKGKLNTAPAIQQTQFPQLFPTIAEVALRTALFSAARSTQQLRGMAPRAWGLRTVIDSSSL